jgi:Mrp family chromosome partitioning ATPase
MELTRVVKAVGARWGTVLAIGLIGVGSALSLTLMSNRSENAVILATAAIRFQPEEGQTIADLAPDILDQKAFAIIAAGDLLDKDPNARIIEDLANARLLFEAQGSTEAEAKAKASALLDSFLQRDPELGGAVEDEMRNLENEATQIQANIDELQPKPSAEDQALADQAAFLDREIEAIESRLVELLVQEGRATSDEQRLITIERAKLESELADLKNDRSLIDVSTEPELSAADQLLLTTLQNRLAGITTEYERLYLRQQGVTRTGVPEDIVTTDLTPPPANPWLIAVVGFAAGILIAVFAVTFLTRTRRTVWLPEDVAVPVLGSIPARPVAFSLPDGWYDQADPSLRKTAIQALRSAVEAVVPSSGTSIAMSRHAASDSGVQALAVDLASSLASAGTKVLVIDADWEADSQIGSARVGGAALSDVLRFDPGAPTFHADVKQAAESAHQVRSGLSVIPSGGPPSSPADALAGPQFRALIAAAQQGYDMVLVVVDAIETPAARVAMQRLGHALVTVTPGSTTMPELNGLLEDLHRLRISILGAVFLGKQDRLRHLLRTRTSNSKATTKPGQSSLSEGGAPPPSPMSRLQKYPVPDERRSAAVGHHGLSELASQISDSPSSGGDDFASELLSVLSESSDAEAYPAVTDYLVARIEDMVTARHGFGDFSPDLIDHIAEDGFVSLRPLRGHRTAASWLRQELEDEAGEHMATEIIGQMERIITRDAEHPVSIDDWLVREFFKRHLAKTEGEPGVWHLTSSGDAIDLLVPAIRLDGERLQAILRSAVSNLRDEMIRFRQSATSQGDDEQAAIFEGHIADIDHFETAMESIISGAIHPTKQGTPTPWSPDWSSGMRANLAVFQQAGLLPFPVLSAEEMSSVPIPA